MKKVLIAGATGYLGRYVIKELKQNGYYTKVLVRDEKKLGNPGPINEPPIREYIDEVVLGDVTNRKSLEGICQDVDYVFSSVGLTKKSGGSTFADVDFGGNFNLLREAENHDVKKFMYIHVFMSEHWEKLGPLLEAKQKFVQELTNSTVNHLIIRPTGYYSDMLPFLAMAVKGRVYMIGSGNARMNPIHGEDLAKYCVENFARENDILDIGGPEVLTYNKIARYAFDVVGKKEKTFHIPKILLKLPLVITKLTSNHLHGLFQFFNNVMTSDLVAPKYGKAYLKTFYETQKK